MMRSPPISTLFPYTTLFRSMMQLRHMGGALARKKPGAGARATLPGEVSMFSLGVTGDPESRAAVKATLDEVADALRSEEHTSELQSRQYLVCRLLLEQKQ